jgi:hypothetical protein
MAEGSRTAASTRQSDDTTRTQAQRNGGPEREAAHKMAESQRRLADTLTEQSGRALESVAQASEIYRDATGATTEDVTALLSSYSVVAKGFQEIHRAWIDALQKSFQTSAKAPQTMLRCTSFSEIAQAHRDLMRENMDTLLAGNAQIWRIAGKIAEDAARPIESRARR